MQAGEKTSLVGDAGEQLFDNRIRSLLSLSGAPPPGKACVCHGTAHLLAPRPSSKSSPERCRHQRCFLSSAHPRGSCFVPSRCRSAHPVQTSAIRFFLRTTTFFEVLVAFSRGRTFFFVFFYLASWDQAAIPAFAGSLLSSRLVVPVRLVAVSASHGVSTAALWRWLEEYHPPIYLSAHKRFYNTRDPGHTKDFGKTEKDRRSL